MSSIGGDVVLRDLQSLLRQSIGKEVSVLNYETSSLLPLGENYGSTMLKVDAVIKNTKESPEEELHLVAKMVPMTEVQRKISNLDETFRKEIFVFEKLVNYYVDIEREIGTRSEDLFDILPKFYGSRLSLNAGVNEVDDDAVLLMENLKSSGYYVLDRMKGLDLNHARVAISALARYHALGMAFKNRKPDLFAEAKKAISGFSLDVDDDQFRSMVRHTVDSICSDPRIAAYEERIRQGTKNKWNYIQDMEILEPWVTIIHGDFWINNILFRKEEGDGDISVKFIDFQVTQVSSPLKDLPYFLCCSCSVEVLDNHFEDLLDTYHSTLVKVLKKTGCDTDSFSRDKFDNQLKIDAKNELLRCLVSMKILTFVAPDDLDLNEIQSQIFLTKGSQLFIERSWKVVSTFAENGWM